MRVVSVAFLLLVGAFAFAFAGAGAGAGMVDATTTPAEADGGRLAFAPPKSGYELDGMGAVAASSGEVMEPADPLGAMPAKSMDSFDGDMDGKGLSEDVPAAKALPADSPQCQSGQAPIKLTEMDRSVVYNIETVQEYLSSTLKNFDCTLSYRSGYVFVSTGVNCKSSESDELPPSHPGLAGFGLPSGFGGLPAARNFGLPEFNGAPAESGSFDDEEEPTSGKNGMFARAESGSFDEDEEKPSGLRGLGDVSSGLLAESSGGFGLGGSGYVFNEEEQEEGSVASHYGTMLKALGANPAVAHHASDFIRDSFSEAVVYKVHIMPHPEHALPVLAWVVDLVQRGVIEKVVNVKIAAIGHREGVLEQVQSEAFPIIVMYIGTGEAAGSKEDSSLSPAPGDLFKISEWGKAAVTTLASEIDKARRESTDCAVCHKGLNKTPRYNKKMNDILYWAQGNGDTKTKDLPSPVHPALMFQTVDDSWDDFDAKFTPALPPSQRTCENVYTLATEYYYNYNCAMLGRGLAAALRQDGLDGAADKAEELDWSDMCRLA